MQPQAQGGAFDFVVIGSGFGGSVSAMRLTEKGYRVLVLERGRRYHDDDFPLSNWNLPRYLWFPALRCFGFQQLTLLQDVLVFHGSGVGGGSLLYANVLMEPSDRLFKAPGWRDLADWKAVLRPHYETARRMLGVTTNVTRWPADLALRAIAREAGRDDCLQAADVGVFFGEPGQEGHLVPDPYFDGEGPPRAGCTQCGGCMVGCRHNAKNTLVKNYLYFAEKWGAEIRAEALAEAVRPLPEGQPDGARYEVIYRRATAWPFSRRTWRVRARQVIVAAGVLGTLDLLFRCRDEIRSLPGLSSCLGDRVRTNSEALLGVMSRDRKADYSQGVAITSVYRADDVTNVEPVRFPDRSSFIRTLGVPLVDSGDNPLVRLFKTLWQVARHPVDFLDTKFFGRWARRTTILLIMQTEDSTIRLRPGRGLFTLFRRGIVSRRDPDQYITPETEVSYGVARAFARKIDGIPQATVYESLLNIPSTAHILGGCPMGRNAESGVVDINCEVFGYPGLYVVDGSIMPANPGINPSLTITALAEYAMSRIPPKGTGGS